MTLKSSSKNPIRRCLSHLLHGGKSAGKKSAGKMMLRYVHIAMLQIFL